MDDQEAAAWTPAAALAVERFDPRPTPMRRGLARLVAGFSRLLMMHGNTVRFRGQERLAQCRATEGRGLLTFSNHVSLFDDPMLTACLVEPAWDEMRWIAADALNFFGDSLRASLFNAGKCVPVVRGAGLDQPGMDFLIDRLRAGEWVHVFPEGGRTRSASKSLSLPFKAGLARLVTRSRPLLLPFHHHGMQSVLPIGAWAPRLGSTVAVRFGEVIDSDRDLADREPAEITTWAEEALLALEAAASGGESPQ